VLQGASSVHCVLFTADWHESAAMIKELVDWTLVQLSQYFIQREGDCAFVPRMRIPGRLREVDAQIHIRGCVIPTEQCGDQQLIC
jgi:hypothetical protein